MDSVPVQRRGPRWGLIFGGCCGGRFLVLAFLVIGGIVAYRAGTEAVKDLDPVGRRFIEHIYANETDSAWAMISDEWKRASNRDDFGKWKDAARTFFEGKPQVQYQGFNFQRGTGGDSDTLKYRLTTGGRAAVMTIRFVRREGKVQIAAANFTPASASEQSGVR